MLRRLAVLAPLLLSVPGPVLRAQAGAPAARPVVVDPALAPIDSALAALYPASGPGAAVLVARDGRVLMRKAYGSASLELGVPLRPEHVFRLGSITKQFTAVAVLMLVEEGKVGLQDEITKFFPDYPTHGRRITVEHLLTHTSGIQSYTGISSFRDGARRDLSVDSLIAMFRDQPMNFAPGERFSYNNSGYVLLGAIIEKVSGMTYADFVRTRIFEPLGMRNSAYEVATAVVPGRVPGYDRVGTTAEIRVADFVSMTQPYAAGALISTVDDVLIWQRAVAEDRLLKPETWRRVFTPFALTNGMSSGYGYGWFVAEAAGKPTIEHGGDIPGFSTNGLWIPSERLHVIVLANHQREPARNPDEISRRIAGRLLGEPAGPAPVPMTAEALDAYTGVYRLNDTDRRVVVREGTTLYSVRGRSPRLAMTPLGRDRFVFASGARVRFIRGANRAVTGMTVRQRLGPEELAPRTAERADSILALANPPAVAVAPAVLDRYVGRYQLAPNFVIAVRREGNGLRAQATGQPEGMLVPESDTRFRIQEVDAAIVFQVDAAGAVIGLVLHQSGRQVPGPRLP